MNTKDNAKSSSAKKLLADQKLPLDASTFNNGLMLVGLLEEKKYLSTTGSGEEKYYIAFTDAGAEFGKNKSSGFHEFKTEAKFYDIRFSEAYLIAVTALFRHAQHLSLQPTA